LPQDLDLAVDLREPVRVAADYFSSYKLNSDFDCAVLLLPYLDLAKLTITKRLAEDVVTKLGALGGVLRLGVVLSAPATTTSAAIVDALAADEAKICYRGTLAGQFLGRRGSCNGLQC
jgi:hypothetical protein